METSETKKRAADKYQISSGEYTTAAGSPYTAAATSLIAGQVPLSILMLTPQKSPTAIVQLVHGMCEHKERYLPFMERLIDEGYACIIHDHRGHGASVLSDEDYGYMYEAKGQTLVEDAHQITIYAKRKWPGVPLILFGHSMGSLVVRVYLKSYDYEPAAVILSGPPCQNKGVHGGLSIVKALTRLHGGRVHSKLIDDLSVGIYSKAFPGEGAAAWICTDKEVVKKYDGSPLCNFKFTLNSYACLMELLAATYSSRGWKLTNPSLPILFAAGAGDPCAGTAEDFKHTVMYLWKLGYYHVQWKRYQNMRHEILNEPDSDLVMRDFLRFISKSLAMKNVPNQNRD